MLGWYEKNYWRTGFKSRLYDWLTPESYFESMRQTVALLPDKVGLKIWDAGCGSGMLLEFLKDNFNHGMIYYGSDLLSAGLKQVRLRVREFCFSERIFCFQNDMTEASPFKENSLDVVIAHFSIYTIPDAEKRHQAIKNMYFALKPEGLLVAICPSKKYDAGEIIKESCKLIRLKRGFFASMIKRIFFYPLTKMLGLNFIQKQLQSDKWMAYSMEELSDELDLAGFKRGPVKTVYAGGAYLMCGFKNY
ncbi:MAG: class I SAM-dependent methyltransferase [Nitrospinae bacterium]|nr:class I SAM-dependent methyltransferase [Nitrospinota bacterium]